MGKRGRPSTSGGEDRAANGDPVAQTADPRAFSALLAEMIRQPDSALRPIRCSRRSPPCPARWRRRRPGPHHRAASGDRRAGDEVPCSDSGTYGVSHKPYAVSKRFTIASPESQKGFPPAGDSSGHGKATAPAEWATLAILAVDRGDGIRLPRRPLLLPAFALHASMFAASRAFAATASASRLPALRAMRPCRGSGDVHPYLTSVSPASECPVDRRRRSSEDRRLSRRPDSPRRPAPDVRAAGDALLLLRLFIPVLYLSIFFGIVAGPTSEPRAVLTGFALLYAASFLGYLLLPSHGPIELLAGVLPLWRAGDSTADPRSVASTGGISGAFPSLHVGATAYTILFDRRHNRLRALTLCRSSC